MDADMFKGMKEVVFRRLTGVKKATFKEMLAVLEAAAVEKKASGGCPGKLPVQGQLLMMLEYWREYRTYLHIARSRGISESTAYKNIRWCEDTLIKSGRFTLPGKKALRGSGPNDEVVLVDVTETPIERPKKSSDAAIRVRKSGTR